MTYLLLHIALWVFVAMLIGAALGWMLRRLSADEALAALRDTHRTQSAELEAARAALGQAQQGQARAKRLQEKAEADLANLELSHTPAPPPERPDQTKRIQALELELSSSKDRVHVLEVELQSAQDRRPPTPVADAKQMNTLRAFNLNLERQLGESRTRNTELSAELEAMRLELADLRRHSDSPPPAPKPQQLGLALAEEREGELQVELERSQAKLQALQARYRDSQAQLTEMIVRSGEAIAPEWLLDAPDGPADDLKRIRGIGPKLEGLLNGVGIYQFAQLAKLDAPGAAWLSTKMGTFPGRIFRDQWVEQAAELAPMRD